MTHDYLRNGVTTLFAAFDVLECTVLGRCMQRHRHQEFLRFLNTIEAAVPAAKVVHVILDNYGSHKHPKVLRWLARHPRFVFHFTPTSGSWLNAVGGEPPAGAGGGRNAERDFHGARRPNDTHASSTDPDARLFCKGVALRGDHRGRPGNQPRARRPSFATWATC